MKIVDAQVHIWGSGSPSGDHRRMPVFSAEQLVAEMDVAHIDGAVIHPPVSWDPDANAVAEDAATRWPDRFAVLGQAPIQDRAKAEPMFASWRQRPGQKGMRYPLVRADQQSWHADGTMDWVWGAAEKAGLPVATMAWRFLRLFGRIAERHPQLKLVIDHLGLIRAAKDEAAFADLDTLLALAKHPNIAIKATGAPAYSTHPYPYANIHDGLHRIYDAYGPRRFFWGTDITRMPCSWRQCVTMFTEDLPWLRGEELEWVMGRGICAWIGWDFYSTR